MKIEVQKIRPFSNGTEFMMWLDANCDRCVKSYKPKGEACMPDFSATQKLVNLGMECKIKFAVDYAAALDGEVPIDIAKLEGWTEENGWKWDCMLYSDDENDGWHPSPHKPKDAPDCQMCLPFAINDIVMNQELVTA